MASNEPLTDAMEAPDSVKAPDSDAEDQQQQQQQQDAQEAAVPEKLADDEISLPLWKRLLYRVFPALERSVY